jgi:cobalt-precorrin-5B (C1)-methyltransferase
MALLRQECASEVEITLPRGERVVFNVHSCIFDRESARCSVIKDAGDDPDVTNGAEIVAEVFTSASRESGVGSREKGTVPDLRTDQRGVVESGLSPKKAFEFTVHGSRFTVHGGKGVGIITKPGLALPVGEPAINPVPRKMIQQAIEDVISSSFIPHPSSFGVVISVPEGERIAKSTLNERLGIVGGISILGTTGIVKPISTKAWADTISVALDVAKAAGLEEVVLTTGRTSEQVAVNTLKLSQEAYIQMGDHVGYTLKECVNKGFKKVTIAGQFGKFTKIAAREFETNVRDSTLELKTLADMANNEIVAAKILNGNTARHAFQILKEEGMDEVVRDVCRKVCENSYNYLTIGAGLKPFPTTIEIHCMLVGYEGEVVFAG